jgi:centractin
MDEKPEYLKLPIVIDIGSGEVKAGFSGEEKPKVIFKNYFGEPKYKRVLHSYDNDGNDIREEYIGDDCEKYLGLIKLRYPVNHGVFEKEQDIFSTFNHIYSKLGLNSQEIKEHPVLITEPILNPRTNREKIAKMLFENLGVPAIFFASQPILSLFSTSVTTGIILESGEGVSQSCVIFEGYSIPFSYERYNYGGRDVTDYLKNMLKRRGYNFYNSTEIKLVNDIKEKMCYLETNKRAELPKKVLNKKLIQYYLPDGNNITIDDEITLAPEILFNPEYIGKEYLSFTQMIINSINKIDIELRKKAYESIWLSGGNTAFKDLNHKLNDELRNIFGKNFAINILENEKINPQYRCWVGGNIISTLEIFKKMWVTRGDWNENGSEIIHIKTI